MNKFLLTLIAAALVMSGCKRNTAEISGTLTNPIAGRYIYLDELFPDQIKRVDSALIGSNGKFNFKTEVTKPSLYIMGIDNNNFLTMIIEPGDNIVMNSYFDSLSYPSVLTGSKSTGLMVEYNRELRNTVMKLSSLNEIYWENINNPDLHKVMETLENLSHEYINEINKNKKNYIDQNLTSLVSLIALYQQVAPRQSVLDPIQDFRYYIKVDSSLSKKYPDNEFVKSLNEYVAELAMVIANQASDNEILSGMTVPDIELPTPDGNIVRLSSTRGSVVLLDFWAAWCPPCRAESPYLVRAYDKYHEKGFQIYQVSLDRTKEAWAQGIKDDKLERWIHVSDLKYWNSSVVGQYNIQSIPHSYLLDKEGRVIATNLRGVELERKLAEIFQ
jgi:thiol-disulfide isomerase/thioredoxin